MIDTLTQKCPVSVAYDYIEVQNLFLKEQKRKGAVHLSKGQA
jgi:hypothetical protein